MTKPTAPPAVRRFLAAIGREGGRSRIARLSLRERRALARKAATARWKKARAKRRT